MSLFGSLSSGVSALDAQSSAMAAISDNISNVNTVGYKRSEVQFRTLVTKQVSTTRYSSGGVLSAPNSEVDQQGQLTASNSSTDFAIGGQGFFIVNEHAETTVTSEFGYTRSGSFQKDKDGFLRNTSNWYLMGWPLQPAGQLDTGFAKVNIGGDTYIKAYADKFGEYVAINENSVSSDNLKPLNLNNISGTAQETTSIKMAANLPAGDAVGDLRRTNSNLYDSLGNRSSLELSFEKLAANAWGVRLPTPAGAAATEVHGQDGVDTELDVYASSGLLSFSSVPKDGETITINGHTFEFDSNGSTTDGNYVVNTANTASQDLPVIVDRFKAAIDLSPLRMTSRFKASGTNMLISQSTLGDDIKMDLSNILAISQRSASKDNTFTVRAVDQFYKNGARLDFDSKTVDDYKGARVIAQTGTDPEVTFSFYKAAYGSNTPFKMYASSLTTQGNTMQFDARGSENDTIKASPGTFYGWEVGDQFKVSNSNAHNGTYTVSTISEDYSTLTIVGDMKFSAAASTENPFSIQVGKIDFSKFGSNAITVNNIPDGVSKNSYTTTINAPSGTFNGWNDGDTIDLDGTTYKDANGIERGFNGSYRVSSVNSDGSVITLNSGLTVAIDASAKNLFATRIGEHKASADRQFTFNANNNTISEAAGAFYEWQDGDYIEVTGTDRYNGRFQISSTPSGTYSQLQVDLSNVVESPNDRKSINLLPSEISDVNVHYNQGSGEMTITLGDDNINDFSHFNLNVGAATNPQEVTISGSNNTALNGNTYRVVSANENVLVLDVGTGMTGTMDNTTIVSSTKFEASSTDAYIIETGKIDYDSTLNNTFTMGTPAVNGGAIEFDLSLPSGLTTSTSTFEGWANGDTLELNGLRLSDGLSSLNGVDLNGLSVEVVSSGARSLRVSFTPPTGGAGQSADVSAFLTTMTSGSRTMVMGVGSNVDNANREYDVIKTVSNAQVFANVYGDNNPNDTFLGDQLSIPTPLAGGVADQKARVLEVLGGGREVRITEGTLKRTVQNGGQDYELKFKHTNSEKISALGQIRNLTNSDDYLYANENTFDNVYIDDKVSVTSSGRNADADNMTVRDIGTVGERQRLVFNGGSLLAGAQDQMKMSISVVHTSTTEDPSGAMTEGSVKNSTQPYDYIRATNNTFDAFSELDEVTINNGGVNDSVGKITAEQLLEVGSKHNYLKMEAGTLITGISNDIAITLEGEHVSNAFESYSEKGPNATVKNLSNTKDRIYAEVVDGADPFKDTYNTSNTINLAQPEDGSNKATAKIQNINTQDVLGVTYSYIELDSGVLNKGNNDDREMKILLQDGVLNYVDIAGAKRPADVVKALTADMQETGSGLKESSRFVADGSSLLLEQSPTGGEVTMSFSAPQTGLDSIISFVAKDYKEDKEVALSDGDKHTIIASPYGVKKSAITFNGEGLPSDIAIDSIAIDWANGSQDMNFVSVDEDRRINLFLGDENINNGMTQFSGSFEINNISQNGAQFGNFERISIDENGIVTARFDNGVIRPVFQVPIATFVNPNDLETRSGNVYLETDTSGQPTVRTADQGGAGSVSGSSLESSAVDLGEEFTNMIVTQRAYSAAAKIITTADEMLDELLRIK